MSQLFDKYGKDYKEIPDNEIKFLNKKVFFKDYIQIGADNEHTFTVPYPKEDIADLTIVYKQGTEIKLYKYIWDVTFIDDLCDEYSSQFEYPLTKEESLLFNDFNKDTWVQLQVVLTDGERELSQPFALRLLPTLFTKED